MKIEMKKGDAYLTNGEEGAIEISPKNGTNFHLEELYKMLDCSLVQVLYLKNDIIMIIDEEGKFKESNIINLTASVLYNAQFGKLIDPVVGKAIVCQSKMFR